jgi:hypothetical protein
VAEVEPSIPETVKESPSNGAPKSKKTTAKPSAPSKTAVKKAAAPKSAEPKKAVSAPKPETATLPVDRAEDVLDEVGKKLGGFLASASKSLQKIAAVAKEEAEDLWAEAQSIRRGDIQ